MIRSSSFRFRINTSVWAGIFAFALSASLAFAAASDVVGEWDAEMDFQGNKVPAKLKIEEKGGALTGTWSARQAETPLTDVKYDAGKLTFKRKLDLQGQQMELAFEGKLEQGKLVGAFNTEAGSMPVTAKRADGKPAAAPAAAAAVPAAGAARPTGAAPATAATAAKKDEAPTGPVKLAGNWHMVAEMQGGETDLAFKEEAGKFSAVWTTDLGTANFPEVKVEGNNVSFNGTASIGGTPMPISFKGVTGGDKIKGTVSLQVQGQPTEVPVNGTRQDAKPAQVALTGPVNLPGTWQVDVQLPEGNTSHAQFIVEEKGGKLTGKLVTEIGEGTASEIQVDGNKFHYALKLDMAGTAVPVDTTGTTAGDRMIGVSKVTMDGRDIDMPLTGKKDGAAAATAEPALTGPVNLPGAWAILATLPDGNVATSNLTVEQKEGKLIGTLTTDIGNGKIDQIYVEGNKFHFSTSLDMAGTLTPLEVSGTTGGDKMAGVAKIAAEGQTMEIKIKATKGAAGAAGAAGAPAAAPKPATPAAPGSK